MSAAPSNTPIDTVEALEAQMAALEQQMPAACAEKARLAAEAEEKHLEEERLREEEKQKEAEETQRRLAAAKSLSGPLASAGPQDGSHPCKPCLDKKRACVYTAMSTKARPVNTCNHCRKTKAKCYGSAPSARMTEAPAKGKKRARAVGTPSPKGKGKRHQRSPELLDNSVEIIPRPHIISEELGFQEYDDQASVAAINDMVSEMARTNSLLERNIQVAEGSTAAIGRFIEEQRVFQAFFLAELRRIFPVAAEVEKELDTEEETEEGEEDKSGGDEQMKVEE
ncbi:hypothetical protein P692DRAFT_20882257 [Suillus brevipes Sb2]|nr:hypothetical protein P692DRAFT_20882257 [Suillus brevipes Sb2]